MHKHVVRAHIETLIEWASLHSQSGLEGSSEVAFNLTRAARGLGKIYGIPLPNHQEPRASSEDAPVTELRE